MKTYPVEQDLVDAIERRFVYHPPHGDQGERYEHLRNAAKIFAMNILLHTPQSREQSLALTKLDEVVMHANSAIARNEVESEERCASESSESTADPSGAAS